jgi:hypothetical protein
MKGTSAHALHLGKLSRGGEGACVGHPAVSSRSAPMRGTREAQGIEEEERRRRTHISNHLSADPFLERAGGPRDRADRAHGRHDGRRS